MAGCIRRLFLLCLYVSLALPSSAQAFDVDGLGFRCTSPGEVCVTGKSGGENQDINIPATVNHAGQVFRVTSVAPKAFKGSTIRSVVFPATLTAIDDEAFLGCTTLQSVTIPVGVTELLGSSFAGCTSLTAFSVAQGNFSYAAIDGVLFNYDHTRLVCFPAGKTGEYTIPDDVTSIERGAFYDGIKIERLVVPASVAVLEGADADLLAGCDSLKSIVVAPDSPLPFATAEGSLLTTDRSTLLRCPRGRQGEYAVPECVTTLSPTAFNNCSRLTSIWLHEGIKSISAKAFDGCDSIVEMTVLATTPPEIVSTGSLSSVSIPRRLTIHVPKAAKKAYKKASFWCEHKIVADVKPTE